MPPIPPRSCWTDKLTSEQLSQTGVYCIICRVNGKRYVGSAAVSFRRRIQGHLAALRKSIHSSKHLQNAWNKYGRDQFLVTILEECLPEVCIKREQYWIDSLDTSNEENGYNLSPTAGSTLGCTWKHSEEVRERLRELGRNRVMSEETKQKLRDANTGKTHTEEAKRKMSETRKGKPSNMSEEGRRRVSKAGRGRTHSEGAKRRIGEASARRKHSEEARKKISVAQLGKRVSEETKRKIREANRGKRLSEETKRKIGNALRNPSEETLIKMREGARLRVKRQRETKQRAAEEQIPLEPERLF